MADGLSIAASVAGLVSLGLQVAKGLTKYINAVRGRKDELESAKRHVGALTNILQVLGASSFPQSQHQSSLAVVASSIQQCEVELKALNKMVTELSRDPQAPQDSTVMAVKKAKDRLVYPFVQHKMTGIEGQLKQSIQTLQLTLQVLQINVSMTSSTILQGVEGSTESSAANLVVLSSRLRETQSDVSFIRNEIPAVKVSVESSLSASAVETRQLSAHVLAARDDISHTRNSISSMQRQLAQMMRICQENRLSESHLLGRIVSKPSVCQEVCDSFVQSQGTRRDKGDPGTQQRRHVGSTRNATSILDGTSLFHNSLLCDCRVQKTSQRKRTFWSQLQFQETTTTVEYHQPPCPLAFPARQGDKSWEIRYCNVPRLLLRAVQVSFSLTVGAGGRSISPMLAFNATVDENTAPAFRAVQLMQLIQDYYRKFRLSHIKLESKPPDTRTVLRVGLEKISKLFSQGKASPNDVNVRNETLMHKVIKMLHYCYFDLQTVPDVDAATYILNVFRQIASYGIPVNSYDISGTSIIRTVLFSFTRLSGDIVNILFDENSDIPKLATKIEGREVPLNVISDFESIYIRMQRESFPLREALQCGPLSQAVLEGDPTRVKKLLERFPAMLEEENALQQTPVHLAFDRPAVLEPLLAAAKQRHVDKRDMWGRTAIQMAVEMSGDNCASESGKEIKCKKCHCSQTTVMLLRADCAIPTPLSGLQNLLNHASLRCKKRFIKGMKDRRERLKSFAHQHLPKSTMAMLMVDDECVLDFKALAVFQALLARGLDPPSELSLGLDLDPLTQKGWSSVYHNIDNPRDAHLFFTHGFQDMYLICDKDFLDSGGLFSLSMKNYDYSEWLIYHGANLFKPLLQPNDRNLEWAKINAHYIFNCIGNDFKLRGGIIPLERVQSLKSLIFPYDIVDDCRCGCSEQGCTPFGAMLENLIQSPTPRSRATEFKEYVGLFSNILCSTQYREALRYFTFEFLEIEHTCVCHGGLTASMLTDDDLCHIRDEQSDILQLLESLVKEFGDRLGQVLADPGCSVDEIYLFWEGYWVDRMEEEMKALASDELSDEQRLAAERIGVVWKEPRHSTIWKGPRLVTIRRGPQRSTMRKEPCSSVNLEMEVRRKERLINGLRNVLKALSQIA